MTIVSLRIESDSGIEYVYVCVHMSIVSRNEPSPVYYLLTRFLIGWMQKGIIGKLSVSLPCKQLKEFLF